jgi:intein/homing endonuclease
MELNSTIIFEKNYNALQEQGVRFVINEGGSRCFSANQLVKTTKGLKPISEIQKGETVFSYNEETKQIEHQKVLMQYESENEKKCLRIKLKNGQIIEASEDHKFYFQGGWVSLKNIVSLWDEMDKNKRF